MNTQAYLNDAIARRDAAKTYDGLRFEIEQRVMYLVEKLIASDDEQARGAIKEFRRLIDLPADLDNEVNQIAAELTE